MRWLESLQQNWGYPESPTPLSLRFALVKVAWDSVGRLGRLGLTVTSLRSRDLVSRLRMGNAEPSTRYLWVISILAKCLRPTSE